MKNKIDIPHVVYGAYFGYIFLLGFYCIFKMAYFEKNVPSPINDLPNFSFNNNYGEVITKDSLINNITIIDFIFTRCKGTCPIMSDYMGNLYRYYKNQPDVLFLSITVDPDYDTEEILNIYSKSNNITDRRWYFLTGSMQEIKKFSKEGFSLVSDFFPSTHTKNFYLVDNLGRYRKFYDGTNLKSVNKLKKHINILIEQSS